MTKQEMLEVYREATEPVTFVKIVDGEIQCTWANWHEESTDILPSTDDAIVAFLDRFDNPVPAEVSSGQIILALAELDWLDAVDAAVAQADALSQRLWARASRFPRNDAMVIAIGTAIGKTSDDLDALFRLAATK